MKNKKIAIFMLVIGTLLIVLGTSIIVYKEINNKKNEKQELENNIVNSYNKFRENVDLFESVRSSYYSDVVGDLYVETVKDNYTGWIATLNNYTDTVDKVDESSSYLKEECINKYFSNKDIKNKCESFVIAYETVVNYYTKDIIEFNELLGEYRNLNDETLEESEIKDYSLKYNYTDINSDGIFKGKD